MSRPQPGAGTHAAVSRALGRLDPYSFFVVPAHEWNADLAVVGTTGAFLILACDLTGLTRHGSLRSTIGGEPVVGLRKLRHGERRLSAQLGAASMLAQAVPMVCLTQAIAGPPVDIRGVRFVKVDELARDISARTGVQAHTRAQAAARVLGMHIAGDQDRHFTVRG